MNKMRREAEKTRTDKMRSMKISTADLGTNEGVGHVLPADDGTQGVSLAHYAEGYKRGGRVKESGKVDGAKAKKRLDRGKFASGGNVGKGKKASTVVNVIVAPSKPNMPAVPSVPPAAAAPVPSPMPPAPPPGMPMRKRGGRVSYPKMKYGAGSGKGRLEKCEEYGDK